jgi:hypothetical protein
LKETTDMNFAFLRAARRARITVSMLCAAALLPATGAAWAQAAAAAPAAAEVPGWIQRGLPGPHHQALQALAGRWRVDMGVYGTLGRDPNAPPQTSSRMTTVREWIGGGRYLQDTTEGEIGGHAYWRRGWLGYSNMDGAYEWVTVDSTNANMMIYSSERVPTPATRIELKGVFTDQGVTGEQNTGRRIPMRTEIRIESADRHVIELYFTPPGGREVLATRQTYTRVAP